MELTSDLIVLSLLLVETSLLVLTIYLIGKVRDEYRGRKMLLERMDIALDLLGRREYFHAVIEAYRDAKAYVVAIVTGSKPSPEETSTINMLLNLMKDRRSDGVRIRILMPKTPDRLYMGYKYSEVGVDVKFSENVFVHDLRYMVVDGKIVVMGFPLEYEAEKPTMRGIKIYSETLSNILFKNFEMLWGSKHTVTFDEYLKDYLEKAMESGLTLETISRQLGIPIEYFEDKEEKHF